VASTKRKDLAFARTDGTSDGPATGRRRASLEIAPEAHEPDGGPVARAVSDGLLRADKRLPAWLFYDAEGSRLYEQITQLPEYYLTRAERSIFEKHSDAIVASAAAQGVGPQDANPKGREPVRLHVAELGAGAATKTQVLLRAVVRRQGKTTFVPADVSRSALEEGARRMAHEEPELTVLPALGHHEDALGAIRAMPDRQLVLFIGSSIGNYAPDEARALLSSVRGSLRPGAAFLLGTDLKKSPGVLIPAYDDSRGVTAAFNKNVLRHINRELGADFDVERFRHVALWNEAHSRIEMHLESLARQAVRIDALGVDVILRKGERIHTESSVKYDDAMVDSLLGSSGFGRERTFLDDDGRFAVHLAKAT
jgi:dimethylhistidine N-methyltransferase